MSVETPQIGAEAEGQAPEEQAEPPLHSSDSTDAGSSKARAQSCWDEVRQVLARHRCALTPAVSAAPPDGRIVVGIRVEALSLIDLPPGAGAPQAEPSRREAKILGSIFNGARGGGGPPATRR